MICETCSEDHDGSFGSGRFCTVRCARLFSKQSSIWRIPKKEFIDIANKFKTYTEICEYFETKTAGGKFDAIKRRCLELNITHFHENRYRKRDRYLIPIEEHKERGSVKNRILRDNLIPYICVKCNNDGSWWVDGPLVLELHHKNGIDDDHRLENLEFLCPNCHSQTGTFNGRNKLNQNKCID